MAKKRRAEKKGAATGRKRTAVKAKKRRAAKKGAATGRKRTAVKASKAKKATEKKVPASKASVQAFPSGGFQSLYARYPIG